MCVLVCVAVAGKEAHGGSGVGSGWWGFLVRELFCSLGKSSGGSGHGGHVAHPGLVCYAGLDWTGSDVLVLYCTAAMMC